MRVSRCKTISAIRSWRNWLVTLLLLLAGLPHGASASTIAPLDFSDLVTRAELVFEGTVLSVESVQQGPRQIVTQVYFDIEDIIKGDYAADELMLSFLGGQVGNRVLKISELQIPQPGEKGVYFVASVSQPMVNPLVGWAQGHFLVQQGGASEAVVLTSTGDPVVGVNVQPQPMPLLLNPGSGVARGVSTLSTNNQQRPLTLTEFKQQVHQAQQLTGTAVP